MGSRPWCGSTAARRGPCAGHPRPPAGRLPGARCALLLAARVLLLRLFCLYARGGRSVLDFFRFFYVVGGYINILAKSWNFLGFGEL